MQGLCVFYSFYGMFDSLSAVGLFTGAWAGVSGGVTCSLGFLYRGGEATFSVHRILFTTMSTLIAIYITFPLALAVVFKGIGNGLYFIFVCLWKNTLSNKPMEQSGYVRARHTSVSSHVQPLGAFL